MDQRQTERLLQATDREVRQACLVAGCACKDPRIVSTRKARFFAAWAKDHGETANRVVQADPTWRLTFTHTPAA